MLSSTCPVNQLIRVRDKIVLLYLILLITVCFFVSVCCITAISIFILCLTYTNHIISDLNIYDQEEPKLLKHWSKSVISVRNVTGNDENQINQTQQTTVKLSIKEQRKLERKSRRELNVTRIRNEKEQDFKHVTQGNSEVEKEKHYLCANWNLGRFGNLMFIYASLYAIAKHKGMTFVVNDDADILKVFTNLKAKVITNASICQTAFWYAEIKPSLFEKEVYDFPTHVNIYHDSYLQSYYYFSNVEDEIREQFTFPDFVIEETRDRIRSAVNVLKQRGQPVIYSEIVGVHVRLDDKNSSDAREEGHLTASKYYIRNALNYFKAHFKSPVFIVMMEYITKDVNWVKDALSGHNNDVVFFGNNSIEIDLCAITLLNHTIITTGTLGWWGAWLCNGTTVYCKDFAKVGSEVWSYYSPDRRDYFPPRWIGL